MKVLHISTSIDPKKGGVSQAVFSLVKALEIQQVKSEIACIDASFDIPEDQEVNCPIHFCGPAQGVWQSSRTLFPFLQKNWTNFDAVIVHGLWLYADYISFKIFSEQKKTPLWIMPHGMLDPYFQKASGRKIKAIRNWLYWKLLEGKIINQSTGILFTCAQEKTLAATTFAPYHPHRAEVVGLGINPPPLVNEINISSFNQFYPALNNQPYFLYLARIHPKKGLDLLIDAYLKLSEKLTLPHLVVAGPEEDAAYTAKVKKAAALSDKIHFVGMIQGQEKWSALYNCEAFILPSHQENFGISVVEAMACGKIPIITNQVNIYEEVAVGGGIVVMDDELGVLKGLETFINLTSEEKTKREALVKSTFENNFSLNAVGLSLKSVLNK